MKKDKEKVLDEVWTQEHVKSFLNVRAHDGTSDDFHMLLKAYQSMRVEDFELFITFFSAEDRDLNAADRKGRTLLTIIDEHRHGVPYAAVLRDAGAV
ncbi:MAG: PA4642 family protein [Halioglobus sp.]